MKYFEGCKVDIRDLFNLDQDFMAHSRVGIDGEIEFEKIEDHLDLTLSYFEELCKKKGLYEVFDNMYNSIFNDDKYLDIYKRLIYNAVYFHDFGKINTRFQVDRLKNNAIKKDRLCKDANHSMYSAWMYFSHFYGEIVKNNIDNLNEAYNDSTKLAYLLLICTDVINSHHSTMKNKGNIFEVIKGNVGSYNKFLKKYINSEILDLISDAAKDDYKFVLDNQLNIDVIENIYIFSRFLFGLLTQSDILATIEFINGIKITDFGLIDDFNELEKIYLDNQVISTIAKYKNGEFNYNENDINKLRSDMFIEAEENLSKCSNDKNIFQVEAPTGAGKTLISLNLAMKLLKENKEINKVFYAFPFNTLVEQTYDSICKIFDNEYFEKQIAIYNSINSFEGIDTEDERRDYNKLYYEYQFLYTPFVISTNIKLFEILFGCKKSSYYPLPLIANSIVIVDEVQAYKNVLWPKIIRLFNKYAKLLNIKIIIMSATLPNLNLLLKNENVKDEVIPLITNTKKYYGNKVFKNRVAIDFSLLDKNYNTEDKDLFKSQLFEDITGIISDEFKNNSFILVEFIKKRTAREFRDYIKERIDFGEDNKKLFLITGTTNRKNRKQTIAELKAARDKGEENEIKYLIVSTQVIEAGVDIDMDIGIKDISLLDSEEQFLGRINRSFKRNYAKAYFFNFDHIDYIYKNDARTEKEFGLINEDMRKLLVNKEFNNYYDLVIDEMKSRENFLRNQLNPSYLNDALVGVDHNNIENYFRLIDKNEYKTVFLNAQLFENENPKEIWNEYKELIMNFEMNISEKKIKLIKMRSKMESYLYDVPSVDIYEEVIAGIYFINDADKYFVDGEFYVDLFCNQSTVDFL